jgi:hypothetical protein
MNIKPRKQTVILTKQDELFIMDELINKKTQASVLAKKFNVTDKTIYNVRQRMKDSFESLTFYLPGPVIDRKLSMTTEERIKALGDDAASVMELSMNLAKFKLERDMAFMKKNPLNAGLISMKEVTEFFDKSASYVLQKKTANIKAEKPVTDGSYTGKLHKLFEQQTQEKNGQSN